MIATGCYVLGGAMIGGSLTFYSLGKSTEMKVGDYGRWSLENNKILGRNVKNLAIRSHVLGIGLLATPTVASLAMKLFHKVNGHFKEKH